MQKDESLRRRNRPACLWTRLSSWLAVGSMSLKRCHPLELQKIRSGDIVSWGLETHNSWRQWSTWASRWTTLFLWRRRSLAKPNSGTHRRWHQFADHKDHRHLLDILLWMPEPWNKLAWWDENEKETTPIIYFKIMAHILDWRNRSRHCLLWPTVDNLRRHSCLYLVVSDSRYHPQRCSTWVPVIRKYLRLGRMISTASRKRLTDCEKCSKLPIHLCTPMSNGKVNAAQRREGMTSYKLSMYHCKKIQLDRSLLLQGTISSLLWCHSTSQIQLCLRILWSTLPVVRVKCVAAGA